MEENKKKLVILTANNTEHIIFKALLKNYFDVEFFNVGQEGKQRPDLIIFTGGEDVNPNSYGENKGKHTYCNNLRDNDESEVFNKYHNIPKLAICRGSQLLTVLNGGKLVQHVEGHGQTHEIDTIFNTSLVVTSTHHQMMFPFNIKDPKNYEVLAWSKYYQSNTYLNGNNEEIKLPSDFLEPEIVYYPGSNSLCIQGHPEYNHAGQEFKDFTINLMKKYLFKENIELDQREELLENVLEEPHLNKGFDPYPNVQKVMRYTKQPWMTSHQPIFFGNSGNAQGKISTRKVLPQNDQQELMVENDNQNEEL